MRTFLDVSRATKEEVFFVPRGSLAGSSCAIGSRKESSPRPRRCFFILPGDWEVLRVFAPRSDSVLEDLEQCFCSSCRVNQCQRADFVGGKSVFVLQQFLPPTKPRLLSLLLLRSIRYRASSIVRASRFSIFSPHRQQRRTVPTVTSISPARTMTFYTTMKEQWRN